MRRAAIAACLLGLLSAPAAEARTAARTAALVEHLAGLPDGPRRPVLEAALAAYEDATSRGVVARTELLTVIDYSRPSTEPRLWVLDLQPAGCCIGNWSPMARTAATISPSASPTPKART